MNKLSNRLNRLEDKIEAQIQSTSKTFTEEQVEACKALCLTYLEHFGKAGSIDRLEEQETNDLQKLGYRWFKNLAGIIAHLACHPDLIEKLALCPSWTR